MAQERFVEAEYFEDFDPERFAEQIKREAAQRKAEDEGENTAEGEE